MLAVLIENAFNFLSPEYAAIFGASKATGFQHPVWLDRLYGGGLLAPNGAEPLIIVVRSHDGTLLLVLPLVRRRYGIVKVVEFADLGVSDYASAVYDPAALPDILADKSALERIRRLLKPCDLLRIRKLSASALPLTQLLGVTEPASMKLNSYAVALDAPYTDWRARAVNRSYQKELDKKSRQLHRKGQLLFEAVTEPALIQRAFDQMRIYRKLRFEGREGVELLQQDAYFNFYRSVASGGSGGPARTYVMSLDDRPIACVFGIAMKRQFLVLLGGFDQVGFKNQSIGALMFEQVARDCIERCDTVLDFTIGDEPYKLTFGAQPAPMWMLSKAVTPLGWLAQVVLERVPGLGAMARRWVQGGRGTVTEAAAT